MNKYAFFIGGMATSIVLFGTAVFMLNEPLAVVSLLLGLISAVGLTADE